MLSLLGIFVFFIGSALFMSYGTVWVHRFGDEAQAESSSACAEGAVAGSSVEEKKLTQTEPENAVVESKEVLLVKN